MLDRDWNAAVNVLNRVGWGTAESTPGEIQPLLRPCVVAEQAGSKNQEAHDLKTWEDVTEKDRASDIQANIK